MTKRMEFVLKPGLGGEVTGRPFFRLLWVGRGGFGLVWRGVEHQFYRDLDGSMGRPWTHHRIGWWDQ